MIKAYQYHNLLALGAEIIDAPDMSMAERLITNLGQRSPTSEVGPVIDADGTFSNDIDTCLIVDNTLMETHHGVFILSIKLQDVYKIDTVLLVED